MKFVKFSRITFLQNTSGGCFCRQNRSKESRYSKKRYSTDFFSNIMKVFFDYETITLEVMKKQVGKT